ncbi:MAG: NTP transferase domain-containing protein [Coriobacteriales bacterium]|nr:NTP transferase domain-containing protein [Coriobacteriales bacterium]
MPELKIAALIPTDGIYARAGEFVPLTRIGRVSVIRQCVQTALVEGISAVYLVSGKEPEKIRNAVRKIEKLYPDVTFVYLQDPWYVINGMLGLVQCGLEAVSEQNEFDAVIVTPGDTITIESRIYQCLVKRAQTSEYPAICTYFKAEFGYPVLIKSRCFKQIMNFDGVGFRRSLTDIEIELVRASDCGVLLNSERDDVYSKMLADIDAIGYSGAASAV